MPAQSVGNNLQLDDIPDELVNLTSLERHIISRRIPFAKMLALPRGKQLAIRGPVVNVPSVPSTVVDLLPRLPMDTSVLPLKLKRRLSYRGHYMFDNIQPLKVCILCLIFRIKFKNSRFPVVQFITISNVEINVRFTMIQMEFLYCNLSKHYILMLG